MRGLFEQMKQRLLYLFEILLSAGVVGALLYLAFYYHPTVHIDPVKPSPFGYRNAFYGVTLPGDGTDTAAAAVVWAAGTQGRVVRSEDGGGSWTIQDTPTTEHLQDIAAWDLRSALAVGDRGTILRTDDGGRSWEAVAVALHEWSRQLLQVYVEPGTDRAWIVGSYGAVLRSADRGRSWQRVHDEEDVAWNDIVRAPGGGVWIAGEFGRLKRSYDEGASWEEVAVDGGVSLMALAFADAEHGLAVGLSGTVLRTLDGGASWQLAESRLSEHLFDVIWDGERYVAVGDHGRYASAGLRGDDWEKSTLAENYFNWHTKIAASGARSYYLAGADLGRLDGGGVWRTFGQGSPAEARH